MKKMSLAIPRPQRSPNPLGTKVVTQTFGGKTADINGIGKALEKEKRQEISLSKTTLSALKGPTPNNEKEHKQSHDNESDLE